MCYEADHILFHAVYARPNMQIFENHMRSDNVKDFSTSSHLVLLRFFSNVVKWGEKMIHVSVLIFFFLQDN